MITVLSEAREFYSAIREVNVLAFGQENEARMVDRLRESSDFIPELSIVALKEGRVVGHILFSLITIQTKKGSLPSLSLAPMAVRPEFQKQGIGSELVRQGLERCRRLGHKIVVVVGHPEYYPRFGFTPARLMGLEAPFPVPDEAFMAIEIVPGALDGVSGIVIYPTEFDGV
ncbi:MAG: GNAT family N-acetyltransferase [Deltaproteobacteria bacterium RBG_16_47_11]|nr:MAG: GNAT family N-acetyltransferase [Deltaproteobacteria bacterium RBG_16_47_11]